MSSSRIAMVTAKPEQPIADIAVSIFDPGKREAPGPSISWHPFHNPHVAWSNHAGGPSTHKGTLDSLVSFFIG